MTTRSVHKFQKFEFIILVETLIRTVFEITWELVSYPNQNVFVCGWHTFSEIVQAGLDECPLFWIEKFFMVLCQIFGFKSFLVPIADLEDGSLADP